MPRTNEIRAIANNSNYQSTPNRAKTISLSAFEAGTILDYAHDLHAEQALEDAAFIFNTIGEEDMKGEAARSLLKFYANVRCLVREIESAIKI